MATHLAPIRSDRAKRLEKTMVIAEHDTPDDVIQTGDRYCDGSSKLKFDLFGVGVLAFAIFLVLVVIIGTPWGLGLTPDSLAYAGGARAVVERGDFIQLPTKFAPLCPILLAFAQLLANDFDLGARLLQAMFMGVNIILIAVLLKKTEQPRVIIAALLILIALQPSFNSSSASLISSRLARLMPTSSA
jgi:hypothetical protein